MKLTALPARIFVNQLHLCPSGLVCDVYTCTDPPGSCGNLVSSSVDAFSHLQSSLCEKERTLTCDDLQGDQPKGRKGDLLPQLLLKAELCLQCSGNMYGPLFSRQGKERDFLQKPCCPRLREKTETLFPVSRERKKSIKQMI